MARIDPQINFRLPKELKDFIYYQSKANGRSVSAELVERLTSTVVMSELFPWAIHESVTLENVDEWAGNLVKQNIITPAMARGLKDALGSGAVETFQSLPEGQLAKMIDSLTRLAETIGYEVKKKPE